MEDVILEDEREHHWRIFFKDNKGGVDDEKVVIYSKRWDLYMNKKLSSIKGGYSI